jgi:hypothetical protein
MAKQVDELFAPDPRARITAARRYRLFPRNTTVPDEWRAKWERLRPDRPLDGWLDWPVALDALVDNWPEHAFGPANAGLLVLLHQPGQRRGGSAPSQPVVQPDVPVLGGVGHLHVLEAPGRYRSSPTWQMIDLYLRPVLQEIDRVRPWALAMIANINAAHGFEGDSDEGANLSACQPGGRLDRIVGACQPKVLLACGDSVQAALPHWSAPPSLRVLASDHPRHWQFSKGTALVGLRAALLS